MDDGFKRAVRDVFERLFHDGLVYRGNYLTNFCVRCHTALSDLEVNHEENAGSLWFIRYPLEENPEEGLIVATTRPETMLGDTAVAVHPKDLRYGSYSGKRLILPLVGRPIPIIQDAFVDPDFGSGAVKITPFHDFADFEAAKRHGLEGVSVFNEEGRVRLPGPYYGMDRLEAREQILKDLKKGGFLVEALRSRCGPVLSLRKPHRAARVPAVVCQDETPSRTGASGRP